MSTTKPAAASEQKLNTSALKKFAQAARRQLLQQVESKLDRVLAAGSLARREAAGAVAELESQIAGSSREQVIERVAYTWFNRFCALRFMDVNRYTRIGVVSPAEGHTQPEILLDAKQGVIDSDFKIDQQLVLGLLDGSRPANDPQQEAYQLLLVAVCNSYHKLMPFMFERIADYTELLIPDDLLSESSILSQARQALTPTACESVETIGWLYQFYISEKKDDVFAALKKGKKITPENIPAATQLFTPHWIVRYLVENSLGRLWMLNHPDSRLAEQMDYYIRPEEPETDFLKISSPEEIKICDPACGSGHMLTYAFDLLYAIYEEQGYQATDIPRLILTNNLYGVEIDQRAGALAAFALTMKAREKYRRFLTGGKVVQPNICVLENVKIDPEDLSAYMDKVGRDLFSGGLQGVVNQWEEADNFGSLIRPAVTDVREVLELLGERQMGEDLFLAGVHQKVLKALKQADYLSPKYHIVVANPPYMGGRNINDRLKAFLADKFADVKSDLFSAFVVRNFDFIKVDGSIGLMTPFTWMFLSSFEVLREKLLNEATIQSLVRPEYHAFFDSAFVPLCAFVLRPKAEPDYKGTFIDLSEFYGADLQPTKTLEAIRDPTANWRFKSSSTDLQKIPGAPIAYWVGPQMLKVFETSEPFSGIAKPSQGLATGENERFVRFWSEVARERIGIGLKSRDEARSSKLKWFPYNKGGEYRKWYGNHEHVVNWENDGYAIRNFCDSNGKQRSRPQNTDKYFRDSLTWSFISSSFFGVRYSKAGAIFDVAGSSAFPNERDMPISLGLLCSKISSELMKAMNPTLNFQVGNVAALPFIRVDNFDRAIVDEIVEISEADWNDAETSWSFDRSPVTAVSQGNSLSERYARLRERWRRLITRTQELETRNNEVFIAGYGLNGEVDPTVLLMDVTLSCNPIQRYDSDKSATELEALLLADTMREFISYAVGCMLGRYSLDKPGLILANQGETADDYRQQIPEPTFAPDEDNVIPLLDGDWFTDDISERFKEFLKVTFGTEHYEENLTFLENALYPDNLTGKKRKTIRDYFLKDFYNHHIKLYKKRPIYWLFSSPKGTFNALIYMHRYRPDTASVVLNGYLREFMTKLTAKSDHLQSVADSGTSSQADKTKALKEIAKLRKDLKELEDYERDILFPLAQQQIEIDLDDGVKVNYNKFGKALKKITGLTGK